MYSTLFLFSLVCTFNNRIAFRIANRYINCNFLLYIVFTVCYQLSSMQSRSLITCWCVFFLQDTANTMASCSETVRKSDRTATTGMKVTVKFILNIYACTFKLEYYSSGELSIKSVTFESLSVLSNGTIYTRN